MDVYDLIRGHEGERRAAYCDKCGQPLGMSLARRAWVCRCAGVLPGYMTIGVGHNLDVSGLCPDAIEAQLLHDVAEVRSDLLSFPWFLTLDPARKAALVDMRFALGHRGFCAFAGTLAALSEGDFTGAAAEMRASKWHSEEPRRCETDATMVETGEWPGQG